MRLTLFTRRTSREYQHALDQTPCPTLAIFGNLGIPRCRLRVDVIGKAATNKDESHTNFFNEIAAIEASRQSFLFRSDARRASAVVQVSIEEFERQREGAVGLRLAIG